VILAWPGYDEGKEGRREGGREEISGIHACVAMKLRTTVSSLPPSLPPCLPPSLPPSSRTNRVCRHALVSRARALVRLLLLRQDRRYLVARLHFRGNARPQALLPRLQPPPPTRGDRFQVRLTPQRATHLRHAPRGAESHFGPRVGFGCG